MITFTVITVSRCNQFYVPQEESCPIPLEYIVVVRPTQIDLESAEERTISDDRRADGAPTLSGERRGEDDLFFMSFDHAILQVTSKDLGQCQTCIRLARGVAEHA